MTKPKGQVESKEAFEKRVEDIHCELAETKKQILLATDKVIARGERLDILIQKTEDMALHAQGFHKKARGLNLSSCSRFFKKLCRCLTPSCCCKTQEEKRSLVI